MDTAQVDFYATFMRVLLHEHDADLDAALCKVAVMLYVRLHHTCHRHTWCTVSLQRVRAL